MGDINLLGMIRNIKNSISGFISTSDKATKSKFGIVKVGDNISVSSGTISVPIATEDTYGVVKAGGSGGLGADILYTQPETPVAVTSGITLSELLTDYDLIYIIMDSDDNTVNPIMTMVGKSPFITFGVAYGGQWSKFEFVQNSSTKVLSINIGGNGHLRWKSVIGIKF